ncbi:MAG: hypothetical protein ABSF95_12155 [Verrucomicrobiota bacterium]|jgi:hypothetical protein
MGKASRLKRERKLAQAADKARAQRAQRSEPGEASPLVKGAPPIEKASDSPEMGEARPPEREQELILTADSALAERLRCSVLGKESVLLKDVPGVEKMSEILGEFARPLLDMCDSKEDYPNFVRLAVVAWNAALLPEQERAGFLHDTKITDVLGPKGMGIMEYLIKRKLDLFPDKKRPLLDIEAVDLGDRFCLRVVSGLPLNDPKTLNDLKARGLLPEEGPGSGP